MIRNNPWRNPLIRTFLLSIALLSSLTPALPAEPAAPWPDSARSSSLSRPSWVLLIPARRLPNGTLAIWERNDDWSRMWRAPATIDGLRIVPLFGDDEDKRSVTAESIDGMMVDSLERVMRKYGAPAVALAVTDGRTVALAGWVPGYAASWEPSDVHQDPSQTKAQALTVLSAMFRAGGNSQVSRTQPEKASEGAGDIQIEAYRTGADGATEYRLILLPPPAAIVDQALERLQAIQGLLVLSSEPYAEGLRLVVSSSSGKQLADDLRAAGFSVR